MVTFAFNPYSREKVAGNCRVYFLFAAKWKQNLLAVLLCLICQTSIFCCFLRKWANAQNVNLFTCCNIINSVDYTSFISDLLQFDVNQSDPPEPKFLALLCVTTNGIILVCCPHNQDDVETGCSVIKKFRHNCFHSCRGTRSIIIIIISLFIHHSGFFGLKHMERLRVYPLKLKMKAIRKRWGEHT